MQIVYPKRVVSQLTRAFLLKQNAQDKRFLHPTKSTCTLIQVDLCGTSQLVQICQPMEFLRMLNCLVSSFDTLSEVHLRSLCFTDNFCCKCFRLNFFCISENYHYSAEFIVIAE